MRRVTLFLWLAFVTHPAIAAEPSDACAYLAGQVDPGGPPIFLASYPTVASGPLHGAAFLYDNAVAAIALVACGDVDRASKIGDAILWAQGHDRFWHDGRLRNGYGAGPATDDPVKLAGWWDKEQGKWLEDGYQAGSDSGNMAWAMLALLSLDRAGGPADPKYRDAAARIGGWIAGRQDSRGAGGYVGGFFGWEPRPKPVAWKSTEHNTDVFAAFTLLTNATHEPSWTDRAAAAKGFVLSMWQQGCACFAVGTLDDGVAVNPVLALDAQIWPLLALPGLAQSPYAAALATSEWRLRVHHGPAPRTGFTYSDAGDAIWTEGTAQMALMAHLLGRTEEYDALMSAIEAERAPGGGYFATGAAALATGFGDPTDPTIQRFYYRLPHLAPTAWAALAERGFNPFTATAALPQAAPAPRQ